MSIRLDGENKAVEYSAVGAMKDAVRVVFRGPRVHDLFDRDWHKVALSVQAQHASLYVDCALVQTLPLEERENIETVITQWFHLWEGSFWAWVASRSKGTLDWLI